MSARKSEALIKALALCFSATCQNNTCASNMCSFNIRIVGDKTNSPQLVTLVTNNACNDDHHVNDRVWSGSYRQGS